MPAKKKPTEEVKKETKKETKKAEKPLEFYSAVGRRREASARIRLYPITGDEITIGSVVVKKGDIIVNDRPIDQYFRGELYQKFYLEPFRTTNTIGRFATTIKVAGGGLSGQLGAIVHGMSRALLHVDEERFRPILRKKGFLTRDPRSKERRKAGLAGKARAGKQSPKR